MQELQAIIAAFKTLKATHQPAAIATLVKTSGSTYRRSGARMLITSEGNSIGTISGGCLESDVCEQAQQVIISGKPRVITYDTTSAADIIWGLGMGCNGVVQVLIEPLNFEDEDSPIAFLAQCVQQQQIGVLATIFDIEGRSNLKLGDRLMLSSNYSVTTNIDELNLLSAILADAHLCLTQQRSSIKSYFLARNKIEVLIELIQPPVPLLIFGAGHDAIPVVQLAKALGWHTTIIDPRCRTSTIDRFAQADAVVLARPEAMSESIRLNAQSIALVMTHNYLDDRALLKLLLPSPVRYVGVLGPSRRIDRLLQELQAESITFTSAQLQRLYSPVGIDIGADTPEEIALSIVAEIQAVIHDRSSGFLRARQQPIHAPTEQTNQLVPSEIDTMLLNG